MNYLLTPYNDHFDINKGIDFAELEEKEIQRFETKDEKEHSQYLWSKISDLILFKDNSAFKNKIVSIQVYIF